MKWEDILKEEKRSAEEILSDLAVDMAFGENDLDDVARNFKRKGFKTSLESNEMISLSKNGKLIGTIVFNMPLDEKGYHDDPIEDILMGEEERKNTLEMLG